MDDEWRLSRRTVERMVDTLDLDWRVVEATPAEEGYLPVYRLTVETEAGERDCVLKAAGEDGPGGVDLEARLLAGVGANTEIPVPTVHGSVETHPSLRTPFFLMSGLGGETVPNAAIADVPERAHRRVARTSGRHLAALHRLGAVDGFGFLTCAAGTALCGTAPPTDFEGVIAANPRPWTEVIESWAERVFDDLNDSRFGTERPRFERSVRRGIEHLPANPDPVLARIDHGFHNLRIRPETGETVGVLDWAFTLGATPAYDLVTVTRNLAGGNWAFADRTPDRTAIVGEALRAGYREGGGDPDVLERLDGPEGRLYDLLALGRAMVHLDAGLGVERMNEAERERVAARLYDAVARRY